MSFDLPLLDPFGLTSVLVSEVVSRINIYTCYILLSYFQQLLLNPTYILSNNVKRIRSIHSLLRRQDPRW
jgi:hypothetical protein